VTRAHTPRQALISGDGIAVDKLVGAADAILFHAYPGGTGGTAIAESILGMHNRCGPARAVAAIPPRPALCCSGDRGG
jgi:hypothetical protein